MTTKPRWKRLAAATADRLPILIDLYRFAARPDWEIGNWRDARETRRALRWLRDLPAPGPGAPTALLVLRREDIFDIKSTLALGAALHLEGVRPVVLANHRRVPRILRYASAFGIGDIRYRDDFSRSLATDDRVVEELLDRGDAFASVRAWTYRGQPLGERVLSTLIRTTLQGEPDLSEPSTRALLQSIALQTVANYDQAETILDEVRPRWVMADETGYAANGPLVDIAIARGLDVLETSPYLAEGALIFKRMNRHLGRAATTSVSAATMQRLAERPWTADQDHEIEVEIESRYAGRTSLQRMYQWNTAHADRGEICRQLGFPSERPLAVVFSHVLWDASFFYGRDLFASYREWLEETVRAAVANPRMSWVIKTHPANAFRLTHGDVSGPVAEVEVVRRAFPQLPPHVRLVLPETRISSLSLYRHAEIGVTVRGTPGLEMACFGKPVVTAGSGHYSGYDFTLDSTTREEYLGRLRRIEALLEPLSTEQRVRARRYAYALLRLRPWPARSFELRLEYPEEGWHPLDRNLVPRARSLAEAESYGDLHRWAEWAVRSGEADYLEVTP
jgi:hypothetical protein